MRRLLLTACLLAGTGALIVAAPAIARDAFAKNYQAYPVEPVPIERDAGAPELLQSSGMLDSDVALMWERGYELVGFSSFSAERQDPKNALKLAASVHARYVIFCQSCKLAARSPFWPTSYAGGYDQQALFFSPLKKAGSGLLVRPATPAERDQLGRNGAVAILAVRNGSPAKIAGLLAGDLVLSANDIRGADSEGFNRLFMTGDVPIRIALVRNGTPRDITIIVPPEWRLGSPIKAHRGEGHRD